MNTAAATMEFRVIWLVLRIWLGWQWLRAAGDKLGSPDWTGTDAGAALRGFASGAVAKAAGPHPSVMQFYANFLEGFVIPNARFLSYLVVAAEAVIGIALIIGLLTTAAAILGAFLNLNFMFAGSAGINPYMYTAALILVLVGANAGYLGVDRFIQRHFRRMQPSPH